MKKVFLTCLVLVALFAIANTASAITCTVDQRPAATLLVPYFQVSYDAEGNLVSTGIGARDTIVTIANASAAPMIAHVAIYDKFSVLRLDFNVALTGFDVQAMRMSDILAGHLPSTREPFTATCARRIRRRGLSEPCRLPPRAAERIDRCGRRRRPEVCDDQLQRSRI